jgi:uncharacterized membrane protein
MSMEPSAVEAAAIEARVRRVEILISNILRLGVIVSFVVIVIGLVAMFAGNPGTASSSDALQRLTSPGALFPHTLPDVIAGLGRFEGEAVLALGLLLLVATPVIRVGVSIAAFVYQKDRVFVIITAVVLALLLVSFILGKAE